jgi:membrane-bound lytic murein transglycosylase D
MESSSCKNLYAIALFFLIFNLANAKSPNENIALNEAEVIKRLETMENNVVEPRYDVVVKSYLRTYLVNARSLAEKVIGRSVLYFPIFERYLYEHNLPTDLKYLAIVESALNPKAISRAGAVGLWQFMPATGRELGLRIDGYVDERCDPERSSEAAMKYLRYLHKRFEDWPLVLAAYNSGSGTISRAVKRARTNNYWKVRRYLPRETHNYVPAFIAAAYVVKFAEAHGITPAYPAMDMQLTETVKVYSELKFDTLAKMTDLSLDLIKNLNPAYKKSFIPAREQGFYLTLPSRVMPAVKTYLETLRPDDAQAMLESVTIIVPDYKEILSADFDRATYVVRAGETIERVAQLLQCRVQEIKAWNQLKSNTLTAGQQLIYFVPKPVEVPVGSKKIDVPKAVPTIQPEPLLKGTVQHLPAKQAFLHERFAYHIVKKGESLKDIATQIPNTTVEQLEDLNTISRYKLLHPGSAIKIKRL